MNIVYTVLIYSLVIPFLYMCFFNETHIRKRLGFFIAYIHRKIRLHYIYVVIGVFILNIIFFFYKPLNNSLLPYDAITVPFIAVSGAVMIILSRNRIFGKWAYGFYALFVMIMYSMFGLSTKTAVTVFLINIICGLYVAKIGRNKIHRMIFLTFSCVFLLINYVAVRTTIPTASMEKEIMAGSTVIANRMTYRFLKPRKGEIIGFIEPVTKRVEYTKRLVGTEGEVLDFKNKINGREYIIDGLLTEEPIYVPKKGDVVKIDKVYKVKKKIVENRGQFLQLVNYKGLTEISFNELSQILAKYNWNTKRVMEIVGNSEFIDIDVAESEYFYTYTLKVEGRNEKVLPIYEFRENPQILKELLEGKSYKLKKDYILPLGDNTKGSFDGRFFGYVAKDSVRTHIKYGIFPFKKFNQGKGE